MDTVALLGCKTYDPALLLSLIEKEFDLLGIGADVFRGKKVVIKPNLLLGYAPEKAATTHPALVEAMGLYLKSCGAASVTLAESPGGPYHAPVLNGIYRNCGMKDAAERAGITLNQDLTAVDLHAPDGKKSKMFHVLTPIAEADVIVNLCKLKTHALAAMTASVKNLFGVIPGIEKFEMHSRFRDPDDFFAMLVDLCRCLNGKARLISVCDAIVGMEGNGPSGGNPREIGCLIASGNPFALDTVAAGLIGLTPDAVPLLRAADRDGVFPLGSEISVLGDRAEDFAVPDFVQAETNMRSKFDLTPKFLEPRPVIDRKKCVGCGTCMRSCPGKTITMVKKKAKINRAGCIRCYCCQELCTFKAVKIRKSPLLRLVQDTKTKGDRK